MRYFADLHMHSRFSRATSKHLTIPMLDEFAKRKGIHVLGTSDFTHPQWFSELSTQLEPASEAGLFIRKGMEPHTTTRFILSVEISTIYSQSGKTRRIHSLVLLPSLASAATFNKSLLARAANLHSDGRPIIGMSVKALTQLALDADPAAIIIPAHAWTPWFGIFGSMSGFDSLEEAFEELTPHILAIETGLSSDPPMNWQWSALDNVALISSSDAHSPPKIAREATELEGEVSYPALREALRTGAPVRATERDRAPAQLIGTVEFFPEEGKYHMDGHREHKICWTPAERKAHGGLCTACGKPVTVGVLSRVEALGDRMLGFRPKGAPNYRSLVPLDEIIADSLGVGKGTKKVSQAYEKLIANCGNELRILINAPLADIEAASSPIIADGIKRMRSGQLHIEPGYDGEFGTVHVFTPREREHITNASVSQTTLF